MSKPDTLFVQEIISRAIQESIKVKAKLLEQQAFSIVRLSDRLVRTFRAGNKIILFGNGGSAADSQHVAGELVNRFLLDRDALPAIALTTDISIITSVGNDTSFDQIFSRQVQALTQKGDVVVAMSTSGNSPNILEGILAAREKEAFTVGFTGRDGGHLGDIVDMCLRVPSDHTPRIQEAHITIWHALCEVVEWELFGTLAH